MPDEGDANYNETGFEMSTLCDSTGKHKNCKPICVSNYFKSQSVNESNYGIKNFWKLIWSLHLKASCKTEEKALRGVNHMNGNDTIGSEIALLHNCITEKIITAAPRPEEIEFSVEEWATYCNVANNFLMKTSMNYPIIYI